MYDSENEIIIFEALKQEVNKAVEYISLVINDYNNTDHYSRYFSDVLLVENYEYKRYPSGEIKKATWGRKGVYVFVVTQEFHLTSKEVLQYCSIYGAGFNDTPSPQELHVGDHYYQGSTISKSLHTRIKEHYSVKCDQASMCLNNPKRIIVKDKLELYLFPVKKEVEEYPFFIRMIEAELHERFKAKTGSKRVF